MANVVIDIDGDHVTVSPVQGNQAAFTDAARALASAGEVTTVTGPTGVALRASLDTAKKAGLVSKTSRRTTKKKD